jgi:hypothetical protein
MIQMTTADAFKFEDRALIGIGSEHRGRFIVFFEAQADLDADVYVLHIRNVETGRIQKTTPIAANPVLQYESFALGLRLPPGRWELELESVNHGFVARRTVRVLP